MSPKVQGLPTAGLKRRPFAGAASAARRHDDAETDAGAIAGEVEIAITDGLGTFWLAPRIESFRQDYPEIPIRLDRAMSVADPARLTSGVAVQLVDVNNPNLRKIRLGRMHAMPFAARSYVEAFGVPQALNDLSGHRLVLQVADQTATRELFTLVMADIPMSNVVTIQTTSSTAHYGKIAEGAGIGFLPTYLYAVCEPLVPIGMHLHFPFDIWLVCSAEAARLPRVQRLIEWLIEAFEPRIYPWFRDHFIHPGELLKEYRGPPIAKYAC